MADVIVDIIVDALVDTAKLIPFLLLTYMAMEYLEHKTGDKADRLMRRTGQFGPVAGGILGAVPQCGFSAAASNLYAGRVITLGTLFAIYLSTSDEMLPIFISEQVPLADILRILLCKVLIGMVIGFLVDLALRGHKHDDHVHIHEMCEREHCHCEDGILVSAIKHTLQIAAFILAINLILNSVIHFVGEDVLAGLLLDRPIAGPVLAGLVGMIPNCAGSVLITQLYLEKAIGFGAAMAGLLNGTGVGLLVLFKVNRNRKENICITLALYVIGTAVGILLELL